MSLDYLEKFGTLHSDAYAYLKEQVEKRKEIVLVNIEDEDNEIFPDEYYELPTQQVFHRRGYIMSYRIWRLRLKEDGTLIADGHSFEESPEDWDFSLTNDELDWSTIIELTAWL